VKLVLIVLLVLVMPVSAVQAETADEVRKRAFAGLVKLSSIYWKTKTKDNKTIQDGAKLVFMRDGKQKDIGQISHAKSISCLKGSIPTPVFQFILKAKGKPERKLSVSIPAPFEFIGGSPKSLIKVVTNNTNEPIIRYATQAIFSKESGQVMVGAVVAKDGLHFEGTPIDLYVLPVNMFMRDAATDLCSESDPDKLLAIAKRHKLIE